MARVLVIEDAEDVRQLLVDVLASMDHTAIEAADGLSGVQAALSDPPDLIILDLMMPAASGGSALQFIRGTPEIAELPVLVLSAHSDIRRIAMDSGADAWLSKPVEIKKLREQIEKLLTRPRTPRVTPPNATTTSAAPPNR
ncbi:MAG: response regulator transcription factor [Aggregatilineales bacterium]